MICVDKYSRFELYCFSAISYKTNEVMRANGTTENTCPSSLCFFHSLATGLVIREANHILIYSVLIDFFKTQNFCSQYSLSSLRTLIRNGRRDEAARYGSVSQMDQISTNKAFSSEG